MSMSTSLENKYKGKSDVSQVLEDDRAALLILLDLSAAFD